MPKKHYKYNPNTLKYERVETDWWILGAKAFGFISAAAILAVVMVMFYTKNVDSPKELALKEKIRNYELQTQIMEKKLHDLDEEIAFLNKRDEDIYREMLGAPLPEALKYQGIGGSKRYDALDEVTIGSAVLALQEHADALTRKAEFQQKSFEEILSLAKKKSQYLASTPAIQPIANKDLTRMASGYGHRIDPFYKMRKFHAGMDFTSPTGTEVHVTGDGVIEKIETKRWGYGKNIVVDHGNGYKTRYAHLSAFKCKVGQKVKRGETIGLVGSTGKSTAPHLHYEVIKDGKHVNPAHYYYNDLTPEEYERLIELSSHPNQSLD
jgi:murein DD-endopeptidase MepM/ murein hydrolase activator NlpD